MKLTLEIIKAELSRRMNCEVYEINKSKILVEAPKIFEEGMAMSADYCYVASSIPAKLIRQQSDTLFIVCEEIPEQVYKKLRGNILYFSNPQSFLSVLNVLLDVFAKYSRWISALFESLLESVSIDALLRLSLPIFENPLYLIDSRFSLIAEASPEYFGKSSIPVQGIEDYMIIRGKDDLLVSEDNNIPFFKHYPKDYPRLLINITEGEYFLGNLSIQASHRPLRDGDDYLLEHLASVIHTALLRFSTSDNNWRHNIEYLLTNIIMGENVDEGELNKALLSFGCEQGDTFRCLAVKIPNLPEKEFIRNFMRLLGTEVPAIYIPVSGDIAPFVIGVSSAIRKGVNVLSVMEEKLDALGYRVGVSDMYNGLLLSQHYFAQAKYALKSSETSKTDGGAIFFSDCCLDYILENVPGDLKPDMLWPEGFKKLIAHDEKGRVNYVETLRAYLDNNLNANRAASKIYLSRNSLLSQLERINALLDEDLNDPKVRFRYELALLLYDKLAH